MKPHILFLALNLFATAAVVRAQTPEKIYPKNDVLKSNDYYLEQRKLWKRETEKSPRNADAWLNYYRADRNAYVVGEETDSLNTKGINRFARLNKIVDAMEANVPGTFEFNYVKWINGNNDPALYPFLEAAHRMAPNRTEPLMSLAYYHELKNNPTERNKYLKLYHDSGEFSPGLLNYAYNMLVGIDSNAIVLTEGDKDTDGILLLQAGTGFRTDVRLLNVNLLLNKEYREHIFKDLGIPQLDFHPLSSDSDFEAYRQSIVMRISENGTKRPVYIAVTVTEPFTQTVRDNLYLTGLTYRYSLSRVESIPIIIRNYEELFAIDYLKVYFPADKSIGMLRRFNQNYFPSLAVLHEYYSKQKSASKADACKKLAIQIATDYGSFDEFDNYFKGR